MSFGWIALAVFVVLIAMAGFAALLVVVSILAAILELAYVGLRFGRSLTRR